MLEKNTSPKKKPVKGIVYVCLIALLFTLPLFLGGYYIHLANLVMIYILLTASLRTIYISGQLSLGHAAFMGIGAYVSAILAKHLGWTPWCTIPIGGLSAMAAGILIGFPFSRLRAIYFSMASLFFGIMITAITGVAPNLTGYLGGMPGIPRPLWFFQGTLLLFPSHSHLTLVNHPLPDRALSGWYDPQVRCSVSSGGVEQGYRRGRCEDSGFGYRVFLCRHSGCLLRTLQYLHLPSNFTMLPSIFLVVYLLVGGTGSFAGPIVGAFILYLIPYIMGGLKGYTPFVLAAVLAVIIYLVPQGIVGLPHQVKSRIGQFHERRRASEYAA